MRLNISFIDEKHFTHYKDSVNPPSSSSLVEFDCSKVIDINRSSPVHIKDIVKVFNFFVSKTLHEKYNRSGSSVNYFKQYERQLQEQDTQCCNCCSHFKYKSNIIIHEDYKEENELTNFIDKDIVYHIDTLIDSVIHYENTTSTDTNNNDSNNNNNNNNNKQITLTTTTLTTTTTTTTEITTTDDGDKLYSYINTKDEHYKLIDDYYTHRRFTFKTLKYIENTLRSNKLIMNIYFIISSFMVKIDEKNYNQFFKFDKLILTISGTTDEPNTTDEHTIPINEERKYYYYLHNQRSLDEFNQLLLNTIPVTC